MTVTKFIYGIPKAQPRARATARGGHARMYDPGTANEWKTKIKFALLENKGLRWAGPISVVLVFHMPRPKSHYGTGRNSDQLKVSAPKHHIIKPDIDNLVKAVYDCLSDSKNGIGLFIDDCQIVSEAVTKKYANKPENAGLWISLEQIKS